jgi:hypothetical protein
VDFRERIRVNGQPIFFTSRSSTSTWLSLR